MPISLTAPDIARLTAGSPSRFDLSLRLLRTRSLESAAEIGVWKGDFAKVILSNFSNLTKYYMIDPWAHWIGTNPLMYTIALLKMFMLRLYLKQTLHLAGA